MAEQGVGSERTRGKLAFAILIVSVSGIFVVSVVAIGFATSSDRPEVTQLVFASVLPLLGTWVGTVLAFYFARENLQVATESSIRLAGRTPEPETPVRDVMIPKAQIISFDLEQGQEPGSVPLSDLHSRMVTASIHRIPILGPSGDALYVVHDSTLTEFAVSVGTDTSVLTQTMADLLQNPDHKIAVEALGFIGPDAALSEARAAMRAVERCNDVFVTTSGKRSDPVIGWVTNTDLAAVG